MSLSDPRTVIVPIDFSEQSWTAIWAALELSDRQAVRILYIMEPLHSAEPGVVYQTVSNAERETTVREAILRGLTERGLGEMPIDVRVGTAGIAIADHARDVGADLVVISSHGRTGLRRLLIGSVAETVVRHAPCPVLVLRRDFVDGEV